ncbi:MAG TPA: hypothetical protein VFB13_18165 [Reyranella sp.]|nr:hypothetical protein [Reyranella sp.]
MRLAPFLGSLAAGLVPLAASDGAYCERLYDYAVRYRGKAIMGEMRPTPDMIVAQEQCRGGDTAQGIGTLERLLRGANITPPPR